MLASKYRIKISQIFGMLLFLLICFAHRNCEDIKPVADVLFIIGILLVAVAILGRIWCSLYISGYKNRQLIQSGPYSICRNPLYFFSLLGGLGIGLTTETITIPVIILLGFSFYYPFVIQYEEKNLRRIFGLEYEKYCLKTPKFFPKFSLLDTPGEYVVNIEAVTESLMYSFWFIFGIALIELFESLQSVGAVPILFKMY